MWANKTVDFLVGVTAFVTVPLQLVTTLLLGCLAGVTLGLALLPFSLIWICLFLGPLLGLSWLWASVPLLRVPAAVPGIPLAVLGNNYTALIPSMGEMESRVGKLVICQTWPFSREFMAYMSGVAKKPFSYELNPDYRDQSKQSQEDFEYVVQLLAMMMTQQKQII